MAEEQKERRESIKAIMSDPSMTPLEKRKSIQSLMDGRRRSSCGSRGGSGLGESMAAAAAAAAACDFGSSDDDDDDDGRNDPREDGTTASVSSSGGDEPIRNNHSYSNNGGLNESSQQQPQQQPRMGVGGIMGGSRRESLTLRRRSSLRGSFTAGFGDMNVNHSSGQSSIQNVNATWDSHNSSHNNAITHNKLTRRESITTKMKRMETSRPECTHYQRNCTIISPCCGLAFGCRICHDDCADLPPPILLQQQQQQAAANPTTSTSTSGGGSDGNRNMRRASSLPATLTFSTIAEESHHNIDRFAVKEVICRECFTRQSSKTNNCIKCNVQFGGYHCNICNLWMSPEEEPYHCADCGFCRVGGKNNFRHCHDCGMCIDAMLFDDHNCKTGKYMSNCPVCQEDLFSSRSASHEMPCGHAIHWHCFRELTSFDTRCPVCKKTAETHEQMAPTWAAMAMGIALQPVPPDLARVVSILCNDCEQRDHHRRWHFLGVQCNQCTSFNTTVETTTLMGREAHIFLGTNDIDYPARQRMQAVDNAMDTGIFGNSNNSMSYNSNTSSHHTNGHGLGHSQQHHNNQNAHGQGSRRHSINIGQLHHSPQSSGNNNPFFLAQQAQQQQQQQQQLVDEPMHDSLQDLSVNSMAISSGHSGHLASDHRIGDDDNALILAAAAAMNFSNHGGVGGGGEHQ